VAEAIVKVQRDFGNRRDRKVARMKYLVVDWGLERFKAKVEEYCGQRLPAPDAADVTGVEDLMGWHEQGDGKLFLGINIENGRIQDKKTLRLKTALHAIISTYRLDIRLTPLQSIIVCDIDRVDRDRINQVLSEHGVPSADELSLIRRYSIACPALPTCGLSITESERVLPQLIDQLDNMIAELSLEAHKIAIHMTGCPNGCTRPYTPDIGLVGRSAGRYTLFLGGNAEGTRLAFIYQDQVPFDEIAEALRPLLVANRDGRGDTESFGNFCNRLGVEGLQRCAA
jgi:sulfite reductase (ferredoxin)